MLDSLCILRENAHFVRINSYYISVNYIQSKIEIINTNYVAERPCDYITLIFK